MYERIQSQQPAQSTLPAVVCTDLIFSHFLCLAIIEPEPYALTSDIPVSHTARWNLNQVRSEKWESLDPCIPLFFVVVGSSVTADLGGVEMGDD